MKAAIPKSRKPSKVSGTEVVKITRKVDVVWSLKGSTEKNGHIQQKCGTSESVHSYCS